MSVHRWVLPVGAVVLTSLLGCDAAHQAPAAASTPVATAVAAPNTSSGFVGTADGRYTFTPTSCGIHREGDGFDIEISGPGKAPDGEMIHVDFSSTANELSIELGVDKPFARSGRSLKAGEFVTRKMLVEASDKAVRVADLELVDEQGNRRSGSLEIDC